jgi:hypothetical protein
MKQSKPSPRVATWVTCVASPTMAPAAKSPLDTLAISMFRRLDVVGRARLLGRLLGSVGPLALAVIGGGAFAKYLPNARWPEIPVSLDDAASATAAQVLELVRYVEQSNPNLLGSIVDGLMREGFVAASLGASLAAYAITRMADRKTTPRPTK